MSQIVVHKSDDVYCWVECSDSIGAELDEFFTFYVPGYRHMPKYKEKIWDGTIHLFSMWDHMVYIGLAPYVAQFAKQRGYTCSVDNNVLDRNSILPEEVVEYVKTLDMRNDRGEKINLFDYQFYSIWRSMNDKRGIMESPTSSGKSAMIYVVSRMLQEIMEKKVLIIVPTTGLVSQMYGDFDIYSSADSWNAKDHCHMIMSGKEKRADQQIFISTWQSIFRMPKAYFDQFGAILVDECHLATADSIKRICQNLTNCPYKFGYTGTLADSKTHKLVLEGLLGPAKKTISTAELMDRGTVAQLDIEAIRLMYTEAEATMMKRKKYQEEIAWLQAHPRRLDFVARLALVQKKNSLVLFNTREHGQAIVERINNLDPKRKTYYIDGTISGEERESIRHIVEKEKDSIIVASYGTFSTGVSIKNIHSVIFAAPSKSKIRVLQSIGRGLRINKEKTHVVLFDLVDDLSHKTHKNFALLHFFERAEFYNREKFTMRVKKLKI